jgi:hypothetical protein
LSVGKFQLRGVVKDAAVMLARAFAIPYLVLASC